jgi:hypothetical protein
LSTSARGNNSHNLPSFPRKRGTHFDLALFSILHEEQHGFPLAQE